MSNVNKQILIWNLPHKVVLHKDVQPNIVQVTIFNSMIVKTTIKNDLLFTLQINMLSLEFHRNETFFVGTDCL